MCRPIAVWGSEGARDVGAPTMTSDSKTAPFERRFSPYENNGGTTIGIAGDDFVVLASDTRLSLDFSILSRNVTKTQQLTPKCLIGTGGCRADIVTLHKVLAGRIEMYKHDHEQDMRTTAVAQMLSTTLYGRRFFPYYAFNVVAGLDDEGKGAVFTYDAVGSFERTQYAAQGAGQKMMIPVLDNVIGFKNREDKARPLTAEETVEIVKDIFVTAGERDIHTGDAVDIRVVRASGVEEIRFDLKRD